jgi:hypothetical protein
MFNSYVACMVQEDWAPLSTAFINHTRDITQQYIMQAFTEALSEYPSASTYMSDRIEQVCEECLATARMQVSLLLALEQTPFTHMQESPHFKSIKKIRRQSLKEDILDRLYNSTHMHIDLEAIAEKVEAAFSANEARSMLDEEVEHMRIILEENNRIADRVYTIADQMTHNVVLKVGEVVTEVSDCMHTLASIMRAPPEVEARQTAAAAKLRRMKHALKAVGRLRELQPTPIQA